MRNAHRDERWRASGGAADFGVDLAEHIQFEIDAMKTIGDELGLLRV
jgi:predicted hydrolase (HD superfamily)